MKAKIWIQLNVEVEIDVNSFSEMAAREKAVAAIDDIMPEQMTAALERAKSIGASYPQDVTEIVELVS